MTRVPLATYRIQLHPGFTFRDAAAIADYIADLGVSHLYSSPYLQAARGSTHGYDVVDPDRVNEELGGIEGHAELCSALNDQGLGQVLDVVPNHMAITGPENSWWWDVLENGSSSPFASYFDVDWNPRETKSDNRILLPVLGDHYGKVLEKGEIRISHDRGRFSVRYYDRMFPVAPGSLVTILDRAAVVSGSEDIGFIADILRHLAHPEPREFESRKRRERNWRFIRKLLVQSLERSSDARREVDRHVEEINGSPDLLDAFLDKQNYRLAFWRTAARDLDYRRFFDINTLIGMRVEDKRVFDDTHRLILGWLKQGVLDGLRIDHPDGLRDPEQYLRRLRSAAPDSWIIVEKILNLNEHLPASWPVAGTTGYEFLNLLNGLFIDPSAAKPMTDFYAEFTGETDDYRIVARQKKHQILHELLASDVNRLTDLLVQIFEGHRRYRDYTRWEINEALRELIACFPVYRTYLRPDEETVRKEDRNFIAVAAAEAKEFRQELDPELFNFLESLLLLEYRGEMEIEWVMRFQQLTGPAMAKGIEDTAFYCYNRFICLNEVGGDPGEFGISMETFHRAMVDSAKRSPHTMLTTSTHDTKRSDDVRARLALLTEIPEIWFERVRAWSGKNKKHRVREDLDRNMEYHLYQTLVGAWPIETERIMSFMEKSIREAKVHTSWRHPDADYEKAILEFVKAVLLDREFMSDLEEFAETMTYPGRINSLAQTLIKLTAPGIPDFYQGSELWDLNLVDPDNRRPVDFELRRRLLSEMKMLSPEEILERMNQGLPKLYVIHKSLELRKQMPDIFNSGDYRPLYAEGPRKSHVLAFSRGEKVITVVPRFIISLEGEWGHTWVEIPEGQWINRLTGHRIMGGKRPVIDIMSFFPVAVITRE